MKKWSLILAIFVLTALYAAVSLATETDEKELGFWVEVQKPSGKPARAILWFERDVTEQFGFFAFAWNESDGYREYLAGPTWKPFKGLQLGLGFGHETIPGEGSGARRIFLLDATKDDINVYVAFERGRASGPWKKITATYALSERFGLGIMHATGLGNGPRVEWNVRKNIQVWGTLLHDRTLETGNGIEKRTTALLAINFSF